MLYQNANGICNTLMHTITILCKKKEYDDALYFADIITRVSDIFELGSYTGDFAYFTIYAEMKKPEKTLEYLQKMLDGFYSMRDAKNSRLYTHMQFKEEDGIEKMKAMIVKGLDSEQALDFVRDNPMYKELMQKME